MAQLETGAVPERAASDYKVEADGGVTYTGAPENYSQDMAAAVASGLELGSMPAPTAEEEVTEETAARKGRSNPAELEKGAQA